MVHPNRQNTTNSYNETTYCPISALTQLGIRLRSEVLADQNSSLNAVRHGGIYNLAEVQNQQVLVSMNKCIAQSDPIRRCLVSYWYP